VWEQHCQSHLDSPGDLPVQCDPLIYGGTLVAPGYCPVCQRNPKLPASKRMYQFLNQIPWKLHTSSCFTTWVKEQSELSGANGLVSCPHLHPRCATLSVRALTLCFHLEDIHCLEFVREVKRCLSEVKAETELNFNPPKRRRRSKEDSPGLVASSPMALDHIFVDQNAKAMRRENSQSAQVSGSTKKRKAGCQDSTI
jgi:copper chaperone CopZ